MFRNKTQITRAFMTSDFNDASTVVNKLKALGVDKIRYLMATSGEGRIIIVKLDEMEKDYLVDWAKKNLDHEMDELKVSYA